MYCDIIAEMGSELGSMFPVELTEDQAREAGKNPGTVAAIRKATSLNDGSYGWIQVLGEESPRLRYWYPQTDGTIVLKAAAPDFPDMRIPKDDINVLGSVVMVIGTVG